MHLLTRIPDGDRNTLLERPLLALEKILLSLQNLNFSWLLLGCLITVFFTLLFRTNFLIFFSIVFPDKIASSGGNTIRFSATGLSSSMLGPQVDVCGHTLAKSKLILLLAERFFEFFKLDTAERVLLPPCLRVAIVLIQELFN